jgi:putative SOS response-associated peptidase YedK
MASPIVDPGYRTGPATRAGDYGAVIRRDFEGEVEMVNLRWGLRPKEEGGRAFTVIQAEGRRFPDRRCLVPASEFYLKKNGRRYRFTLRGTDLFYFAGIWRPASVGWPASYAALTIGANADIAPYHDRQMAVIPRAEVMAWLDLTRPEAGLLRPLPPGSFRAERDDIGAGPSMFDW